MGGFGVSLFETNFSYMLSTPSEVMLTGITALEMEFPEVHATFMKELQEVNAQIKERNECLERRGKRGYTYLMPEQINASIDIGGAPPSSVRSAASTAAPAHPVA